MSKIDIYQKIVNSVPGIQSRYQSYRSRTKNFRILAWLYLLWLNFAYYVLRIRCLEFSEETKIYEDKKLEYKASESSLWKRETPKEFAKQLMDYDVISFDVFDTLLFRVFSKPEDLFHFVAGEIEYLNFAEIRRKLEQKAREELFQACGSYEVTLDEIYQCMERDAEIPEGTKQAELLWEERSCFANPYMKSVVEELQSAGKRIILTSDMYLGRKEIERLLHHAGYGRFDAVYISSEHRKSKADGTLFSYVKEQEGREKSFVHIGDNPYSDVMMAKKQGFHSFSYKNVNHAGKNYRCEDMSVMAGSVYRGIVNACLHNGLQSYSVPFEYGFVYGGLFVFGYCQFIHEYAAMHGIDKILFFSRDGDIINKVYGMMYPEANTQYVYWSRRAATKLAAGYYKYDYFRRFLSHKVNQGYSVFKILKAMELEEMLEDFCKGRTLDSEAAFDRKTAEELQSYLLEHWQQVLELYKGQREAAKQYYGEVLFGCRKVLAVDVGWAGSGAATLNCLIQKEWGMDCRVIGMLGATNAACMEEKDMSEALLNKGNLVSYMFSQTQNRDVWKHHSPGKLHNMLWELLLASTEGSVIGFYRTEDGAVEIRRKPEHPFCKEVQEIQHGIVQFAERLLDHMGTERLKVCGRDAYAPVLLAERNKKYIKKLQYLFDEINVD